MPTFTAIAFDRLIEPRESKFVDMPVPNLPPLKSKPVPHPNSKLERRNSTSVVNEKKVNRPQISPALYATPEATPLPDSPSSFPPSPYIVNHKRRGPRLVKSFSVADVASRQKAIDEGKVNGSATRGAETKDAVLTKSASVTFSIPDPIEVEHENNVHHSPLAKDRMNGLNKGSVEMGHANGVYDDELGSSNRELGSSNMALGSSNVSNGLAGKKDLLKSATFKSESESEDFFDPQESMSYTSNTDGEDNTGADSSVRNSTPMGEFYDAWDEMARRDRQIRKRRQKWVWGSIATAITLGTAALAWSYLPTGTGSSSSSAPRAPEHNDAAKE